MIFFEKSRTTIIADNNKKNCYIKCSPNNKNDDTVVQPSSLSFSFYFKNIIIMVSLTTLLLGGFCYMTYFMQCTSAGRINKETPLGVPWKGSMMFG